MAIGYDAGYYSYLWSEVFAYDLHTKFDFTDTGSEQVEQNELKISDSEGQGRTEAHQEHLNQVGRRYRRCILEPGASKPGSVMLEDFLGRPARQDAFLSKVLN